MKKILVFTLILGFLNLNTLPCFSKTVKVKANTPIEFTVSELKSSADATVGEKVAITIDEDVVVNGVRVFKAGSKGYLYISETQKKAFWGQGGNITVSRGKVYDVHGNSHRIDFTKQYVGKDTTWSVVVASIGLATVILFPLGLFGFVRGKDAKTLTNVPLEAVLLDEFTFSSNI